MAPPHFHDTHEIVIAANFWLMLRYQKTGCKKLARMVEQHLLWMQPHRQFPMSGDVSHTLSHDFSVLTDSGVAFVAAVRERNPMHTSPPSSLLVAALLMLHHPCTRNKTTASFLLVRAAEHADLTPAEREACRNIADDLDNECAEPLAAQSRPPVPLPVTDWGCERYRRQNPAPGSPLASIEKGVFA